MPVSPSSTKQRPSDEPRLPGIGARLVRGAESTPVRIVALAVAFRVLTAVLAFLTNLAFPDFQREQFTVFGRTNFFWDPLARWDAGWYFQIARNGYHFTPNGRDNIAFMPAYPLLMR